MASNPSPAARRRPSSPSTPMARLSKAIEGNLSLFFERLGLRIYDHPWRVIAISVAVCALLAIGFVRFEIEYRGERLFTPQDSESFDHRDYVESVFGFDPRATDVYATSTSDGANILTKAQILAFLDMYEDIRNISVSKDGDTKTLLADCVQGSNGACDQTSVLDFWNYDRAAIIADPDILATINAGGTDGLGRTLDIDEILGGVSRNGFGEVTEAAAFLYQVYMVNEQKDVSGDEPDDTALTAWEKAVGSLVLSESYGNLRLYPLANALEEEESEGALTTDLSLLTVGIILLVAYAYVVLTRRSYVHTFGSMAVISVVSVGLAVAASFGFISALGVKFNFPVATLGFLLMALGVDDAFVIMAAYMSEEHRNLPPRERIAKSLQVAASSITVTSLTDLVAFLAGTYTSLPAIQAFCLFAAAGVTADFLLQVTFFVAALVISGEREAAGRVNLLFCIKPEDPDQLACCAEKGARFEKDEDSFATRLMGEMLPRYLLHPVGKVVTLAVTVVVLGLAIGGATQIKMDFNIEWFVPDDSYLQDTFSVRDTYFASSNRLPFGLYTRTVDYPNLQDELDRLSQALNTSSVVDECFNWHVDFTDWVAANHPANITGGGQVDPASYYQLLNEFVDTADGAQYKEDIVFTSDNSSVVATKIQCFFVSETKIINRINNMKDIRALAGDFQSLEAFAYTFPFLFFDGLDVVVETTLINLALAASAVFVIAIITLASVPGGVIVFIMLISTDVMLLGSFYITDVDFNMVSAVNLVIALGLSVDGNIHIMHAFLRERGTKQERAKKALHQLGASTLNGGISSFLVLLVLAGAVSYVFQVFFRSLIFTVIFGYLHALLVLPVVLSLVGPEPYPDESMLAPVDDVTKSDKESYRLDKIDSSEPAAGGPPEVVNISSRLEHV